MRNIALKLWLAVSAAWLGYVSWFAWTYRGGYDFNAPMFWEVSTAEFVVPPAALALAIFGLRWVYRRRWLSTV